jgi:hypothetical protein
MSQQLRNEMLENLLGEVVEKLTEERPLRCSRADFFIYSEIFAAFIKLEYISVEGKKKTILTFKRIFEDDFQIGG